MDEANGLHPADSRLHQINLRVLHAMLLCLAVGIEENINVISFHTASLVLGGIDDSVDHNPGAVRNNLGVYGDCVVGGSDRSCAGVAAPAFRTAFAGAIACSFKYPQRNQLQVFWGLLLLAYIRICVSICVGAGVGKPSASYGSLYQVYPFGIACPVDVNCKAVAAVAHILIIKALPVLSSGNHLPEHYLSCMLIRDDDLYI